MRKLKLQMQLSIDGYVASPNGELDWTIWNWDDELNNYVTALSENVDQILLGRKLAEGFIPYWTNAYENPEGMEPGADQMVNTPKLVFTHSLDDHQWKNTSLVKGNLKEEISQLKERDGKDLITYGGASFASSLIAERLIDDYYLFINPVALGTGMPIFQKLQKRLNVKLVESRAFQCGITALHYEQA